jgi:hypothetical protein
MEVHGRFFSVEDKTKTLKWRKNNGYECAHHLITFSILLAESDFVLAGLIIFLNLCDRFCLVLMGQKSIFEKGNPDAVGRGVMLQRLKIERFNPFPQEPLSCSKQVHLDSQTPIPTFD